MTIHSLASRKPSAPPANISLKDGFRPWLPGLLAVLFFLLGLGEFIMSVLSQESVHLGFYYHSLYTAFGSCLFVCLATLPVCPVPPPGEFRHEITRLVLSFGFFLAIYINFIISFYKVVVRANRVHRPDSKVLFLADQWPGRMLELLLKLVPALTLMLNIILIHNFWSKRDEPEGVAQELDDVDGVIVTNRRNASQLFYLYMLSHSFASFMVLVSTMLVDIFGWNFADDVCSVAIFILLSMFILTFPIHCFYSIMHLKKQCTTDKKEGVSAGLVGSEKV